MSRYTLPALGLVVLAAVAIWLTRGRAPSAKESALPAAASDAAAGPPQPPAPAKAIDPNEPIVERDPAVVFQRAFWRRPGSDVRGLKGERREWRDTAAKVTRWEWFISVQTTPDFQKWLLQENPFGVTKLAQPLSSTALPNPPDWFASPEAIGTLTTYRAPGSKFTLLLDETSGRLYASDAGGGFAAPAR